MTDKLHVVADLCEITDISAYLNAQDVEAGYVNSTELLVWNQREKAVEVKTELSINDKKTGHFVDWLDLLFNFITDDLATKEYEGNEKSCSNFFPMGCSCGHPGCAGIWDGVYVKYRKHTVEWKFKPGAGYSAFKGTYKFSRGDYEEMICKLMLLFRQLWVSNRILSQDRGMLYFQEAAGPVAIWQGNYHSLAEIENALRRRLKVAKYAPWMTN